MYRMYCNLTVMTPFLHAVPIFSARVSPNTYKYSIKWLESQNNLCIIMKNAMVAAHKWHDNPSIPIPNIEGVNLFWDRRTRVLRASVSRLAFRRVHEHRTQVALKILDRRPITDVSAYYLPSGEDKTADRDNISHPFNAGGFLITSLMHMFCTAAQHS